MDKKVVEQQPTRILVTGGGTGIGLATVANLRARGLHVVAVGRRIGALEEAARLGAEIKAYDVCGDLNPLFNEVGTVDGLVLNAGIQIRESIDEWSEISWRRIFEVNVFAAARMCKAFVNQLEANGGSIVAVSSTLAVRPAPDTAAYAASKAALVAPIQNTALECAAKNVRANVVLPGVVDTPMIPPQNSPGREILETLHPIGRIGRAAEVAESITHMLCHPWMTGSVLPIDGGLLLGQAKA